MDISSPRLDFLLGKNRNRAAAGFKILGNGKWKVRRTSLALPAKFKPGNGDFDRLPPALHPPFMALPEGVSTLLDIVGFFIKSDLI